MRGSILTVALAGLALAGCQTTEEAARNIQNRWLGQPADSFFVANGPPVSSFSRDNGGQIYTWRGGEHTSVTPAQMRTTIQQGKPAPFQRSSVISTYQPAQRHDYVCEAQIAVDPAGVIESVRISRDTDGVGFSLSRCAEVFGE